MQKQSQAVAAIMAASSMAVSVAAQVRTVVMTGDTLPGLNGAAVERLTSFRFNNRGQVAMLGGATLISGGIWRIDPDGGVVAVAVAGDAAPGAGGQVFQGNLQDMSMNDRGQIAFNSFVSGLNRAVWISSDQGVLDGPAYTSGRTYLTSRLDNTGGLGVSSGEDGNDWIQYIRPGTNAEVFGTAVGQESFADNGFAAYREVVNTQVFQEAIQRVQFGQGRTTIVRSRVQNADGITFGSLFGDATVNGDGAVVFRSSFSRADGTSSRGLWVGGTGFQRPALVIEEGDAVPGLAGATFNGAFGGELQDSGDLVFGSGYVDASGESGFGVFSVDIDTRAFTSVITTDTALSGVGNASIDRFNEYYANDRGSVVLALDLVVDGASATEPAIAGYNGGTGELDVLFTIGDLLEVSPGDTREISGLKIAGEISGGTPFDRDVDLRTAVLNNNDQFLFRATFTDGSSGLFVAAIPSPASATLLGLAGLVSVRRRR